MKLLKTKSISYDDVNLIASSQESIGSRGDVPNELYRIIVSPMPSIVGEKFTNKAIKLGLSVCIHRFSDIDYQIKIFNQCNKSENLIGSIGLNDYVGANKLYENGFRNICIDVANGYLSNVYMFAEKLSQSNLFNNIIVGNVHSSEGIFNYSALTKNTNTLVRVGIGGGSMCLTTKSATGFGRGAITELSETSDEASKIHYGGRMKIIADGGIKTPAHAVKAFGAGADYVMMGDYFSVADVAENVITGRYMNWGCASDYNQMLYGDKRRHSEGTTKHIKVENITPLEDLVYELWGGISSGVSYSGYKSLTNFIGNGTFEIKQL